MFDLVNAHVVFFEHSKEISYIIAKLNDQEYSTLKALGRGKAFKLHAVDALYYSLPNSVMVTLRTD